MDPPSFQTNQPPPRGRTWKCGGERERTCFVFFTMDARDVRARLESLRQLLVDVASIGDSLPPGSDLMARAAKGVKDVERVAEECTGAKLATVALDEDATASAKAQELKDRAADMLPALHAHVHHLTKQESGFPCPEHPELHKKLPCVAPALSATPHPSHDVSQDASLVPIVRFH